VSRTALLDVNVLVALFDPDHVHHELAHDWFADNNVHGWATCPVTQNGLIRVLSNPRYGSPASTLRGVRQAVKRFLSHKHHEFWPDDMSLCDDAAFDVGGMLGHRQITDVYLLGLATKRNGHLVTFDRSIPLRAVVGASARTLTVVEPESHPDT
jgi:toxin-antitoxin system PIN domain toxin